jgi:tRNA threonylcarbamoyladenosine biosynthesis protein TsaE
MPAQDFISNSPEETFEIGEKIGESLRGGEAILLSGGLGAGKTLLTKGILNALDFDVDEVTSPSFTLVNLYKTEKFDVYHIDFWRLDSGSDPAFAVGLDEILEDAAAVVIIEWAERLQNFSFPAKVFRVKIEGDGDEARKISIESEAAEG